jgi:hypothetical protein
MLLLPRVRKRTRTAICSAIKTRRVIEFYYHGGFRTVEPYCLGVVMSGEADNESLLCYQTGGHSEYGGTVGWKLYRASEMTDISITPDKFEGDRDGFDPDSVEMMTIYCCVVESLEGRREITPPCVPPAPPPVEKVSVGAAPEKPKTIFLTHNELMRRFRLTHPRPLPDLDTLVAA